MQQKPGGTPQSKSNPTTQTQAIDLMGIFTVDEKKTEDIQANIEILTKNIDSKKIHEVQKHINNKERYDAQYLLNVVSSDNEDAILLRRQVGEEISELKGKMQNTIDSISSIKTLYGDGYEQILAYPDENMCIYLRDKAIDTGAGMEYGTYIGIWHNGVHHRKYFKWRDGFTSDNDDSQKHFQHIKHVRMEQNGQTMHIVVTTENKDREYHEDIKFDLPTMETNLQHDLSKEEQKLFSDIFDMGTSYLIDRHFRKDAKMPARINLRFNPIALPHDMIEQEIPYEKPKLMDTYFDIRKGDAIIIFRAQIDHDVVDGKQYEWVGYRIYPDGNSKQLFRECRYESQIRSGDIVTIKAEDLLSA